MDTFPDTEAVSHQYELALLAEECGEIVQIVGKTLRFGHDSYHPADNSRTNLDLLHEEVGDILAVSEFATERGLLDKSTLDTRKAAKLVKLRGMSPPVFHPGEPTKETVYVPRAVSRADKFGAFVVVLMLVFLPLCGYVIGTKSNGKHGTTEIRTQAAVLASQCYQTSIDTNACAGYASLAERPDLVPPPVETPTILLPKSGKHR